MLEIESGKIPLSSSANLDILSSIFANQGSRSVYFGANGSGKTSLFRYISGQLESPLKPLSEMPRVLVNGQSLPSSPMDICAFVPQSPSDSLLGLPVYEELQTASSSVDKDCLQSLIELLQLTPFLSRFSYELSDGERMRTSIAAALAANKNWLILDEWETHLDTTWQKKIGLYLSQHVQADNIGTLEFVNSDRLDIPTERLNLQFCDKNSISPSATQNENMDIAFGRDRGYCKAFEVRHSGRLHRGVFRKRIRPRTFSSGKLIAVVGHNGSGKSTYLRQLRTTRWKIGRDPIVALVLAEPGLQIRVDRIDKVLALIQCDYETRRYVLNHILHTPPSLSTGLLNFSRRKLLGAFIALNSPAPLVAIDEFAVGLDESSLKTMRAMITYCVQSLGKCVVISAFDAQPFGSLLVDEIVDLETEDLN